MKTLVLALGSIVFLGAIANAWATTDFNAFIPINGALITPDFKFTRVVYLDYPQGGKLKDALDGKNMTISFQTSSNDTANQGLMTQINDAISATESSARITGFRLNYQAQINGGPTEASITYFIDLVPTVGSYVLYHGTATTQAGISGGGTPFILDAAWAGFNLKTPVTLSTSQYGKMEINYPINLFQAKLPAVYDIIKGTPAEKILQQNLMDPSVLYSQQALNKWDHLFDPSYIVSDANVLNYQGTKVPVTTFSTGVSSLQSGSMNVNQQDADFTVDAPYHIRTIDQPASGTVNVEGQAQAYNVKGAPAFTTTSAAASGVSNTTAGGMSNMITYGMAGGAGGIAVIIFIWSNKKMKQTIHNVETGPIQYETRTHWADKFAESSTSAPKAEAPKDDDQPDWLCFKCGFYTLKSSDHCSNCGAGRPAN
ncbi:MAG TPA: hypothetical protein VJ792_06230 [Candidatus Nitrosotalea sp.]|nr:hypothetical protein [Candidatus Nitrosotalea sp.]